MFMVIFSCGNLLLISGWLEKSQKLEPARISCHMADRVWTKDKIDQKSSIGMCYLFVTHSLWYNMYMYLYFLKKTYIAKHLFSVTLGKESIFTWCHGGHIGVPKQWNGGHVGVPRKSSGSRTLFSWKCFLLFQ